MPHNGFNHPSRIARRSGGFKSLSQRVLMIAGTYFGSEVFPKDLISCFHQPFLVEEKLILGVHHPIVAAIKAARFPCYATLLEVLLELDHGLLLPAAARMSPFKVDIQGGIFIQGIKDERSCSSQHATFTTSHGFKNFFPFRSAVVYLSPSAELSARQTEPKFARTSKPTFFL